MRFVRALTIILFLAVGLTTTGCSDALFSGGGSDNRQANIDSTEGNDPIDQVTDSDPNTPVVNPGDPNDPDEPIVYDEFNVLQVYVTDENLSLDGSQVTIDISSLPVDESNLVFIHVFSPATFVLEGQVEDLSALFIAANSTFPTSAAFVDGNPFPLDRTATKFSVNVTKGNGLIPIIGQEAFNAWGPSTLVETYASQFGSKICFYLNYDSISSNTHRLSLDYDSGVACAF